MENEVIDTPAPTSLAPGSSATLGAFGDCAASAPRAAPEGHLRAPPWNPDARAQQRVRVYGRASLNLPGGKALPGSIYDMTPGGVSVVLDWRVALHQSYTLHLNIYRNGKLHNLHLSALSIQETLLGSQGFKHGFQFGAHSDDISQALAEILA